MKQNLRRASVGRRLVVAACVFAVILGAAVLRIGSPDTLRVASAHEESPGCDTGWLLVTANIGFNPLPASILPGTALDFEVGATNFPPPMPFGTSCTAYDIDVFLDVPPQDGVYALVCNIATLPSGGVAFCPATVPYTAQLADANPQGKLVAQVRAIGNMHNGSTDCTVAPPRDPLSTSSCLDENFTRFYAIPDSDADGWGDGEDNCPTVAQFNQQNADRNFIELNPKAYDDLTLPNSDALGDACDPDDDNDGLSDTDEASGAACGTIVTDPLDADRDGDNFLDGPECALGTNPTSHLSKPAEASCAAAGDADGDGISNRREACYYGTDPNNVNTDGDACRDGKEMASINANNAVDVIDLQQIAIEATGVYPLPASAVKADFDITKNGSIDVIDMQQAAAQFGGCP